MTILCLHEGDRVLLSIESPNRREDLDQIRDQLQQRFPGVEFSFLNGIDIVAHQGASGCRGHRE